MIFDYCIIIFFVCLAFFKHYFLKKRLFICEKCNYQCTISETLAKHINTKHESQTHDERVCPICDVKFFSPDDIVSHFRVEHMKKLKCDKCSSNFDYNYEVDNHIIKYHGEKPMPRKEVLSNLLTEKALKEVKERQYNLLEEAAEKEFSEIDNKEGSHTVDIYTKDMKKNKFY